MVVVLVVEFGANILAGLYKRVFPRGSVEFRE